MKKLWKVPRPKKEALNTLLDSFDLETLHRMIAVMYVGRGDRDDFNSMLNECQGTFPKKAHVISQMMEKAPLDKYLEQGLARSPGALM